MRDGATPRRSAGTGRAGGAVNPAGGAQLVIRAAGRTYVLTPGQEGCIGRKGDIHLDDPRVSRRHATVFHDRRAGWVLTDLDSTLGTYLSGQRVRRLVLDGPTDLRLGHPTSGAAVRLGPVAPEASPEPTRLPPPTPRPSWAAPTSEHQAPRHRTAGDARTGGVPATPGTPPSSRTRRVVPTPPSPASAPPPTAPPAPAGRRPPAARGRNAPASRPPGPPRTDDRARRQHVEAPHRNEPSRPRSDTGGRPLRFAPPVVRIGRAEDNDVVLDELAASRHHAELRNRGGWWEVVDMGSHNGTFLDGVRVESAPVDEGQVLEVGQSRFRFEAGRLVALEPDEGPLLEIDRLSVRVGGATLLSDMSLSVRPGEFVAVVGPTGAGKTTLLRSMTGFQPPDRGRVRVAGRSLYDHFAALRHHVGYVPQDDILHTQLTPRKALRYAAALRFPADTTRRERHERVEEVLDELGLADRADLSISKLSGGQRKRTSVALELLTEPSLLFLDEPTSGLDPGYEKAVMRLLRGIATEGRAVVVVTHSVASLHLCDRVLFLGPGGVTVFQGEPDRALEHFGCDDYADVFEALESGRVAPSPEPMHVDAPVRRPPAMDPPPRPVSWGSQVRTLVRRQFAVMLADRRNLAFLAAEAVVPAALLAALLPRGALRPVFETGPELGGQARILLGALVLTAVVVGAANAIREVVKEVPLYLRERAAGLSASAYLLSKMAFIGAVTVAQIIVLVLIATWAAEGPSASVLAWMPPTAELILSVALAGIAAVALGLLLSALVSSSEKALMLIPVVFVVQWLLSGAAVSVGEHQILRPPGYAAASNWGLAAAASSTDLFTIEGSCGTFPAADDLALPDAVGDPGLPTVPGERGEGDFLPPGEAVVPPGTIAPPQRANPAWDPALVPCDPRWEHGFEQWTNAVGALGGLTVGTLALTGAALRLKEPFGSSNPVRTWRRRRRS